MSEVHQDAARYGLDLLEPGNLYTIGRLAVVCLKHEPGHRPHLKLKLYNAQFVESMSKLVDSGLRPLGA